MRNELLTYQIKNNRKRRRRKIIAINFVLYTSSHPDSKATNIEFNTSNQTNLKDTVSFISPINLFERTEGAHVTIRYEYNECKKARLSTSCLIPKIGTRCSKSKKHRNIIISALLEIELNTD